MHLVYLPNLYFSKMHKRTLFIRTKYNLQMLGVIPFIKLQNNS